MGKKYGFSSSNVGQVLPTFPLSLLLLLFALFFILCVLLGPLCGMSLGSLLRRDSLLLVLFYAANISKVQMTSREELSGCLCFAFARRLVTSCQMKYEDSGILHPSE